MSALVLFALACSSGSSHAVAQPSATPTEVVTVVTVPATAIPPTPTPEPPTPEPTQEPTAVPTQAPAPSPRPAAAAPPPVVQQPAPTRAAPPPPPPAPAGSSATVRASFLAYDRTSITVAFGAAATITLVNADTGIAHDIGINGLGRTDLCSGPCTRTLSFTAPAPGSYTFYCSAHPDMAGTLLVR